MDLFRNLDDIPVAVDVWYWNGHELLRLRDDVVPLMPRLRRTREGLELCEGIKSSDAVRDPGSGATQRDHRERLHRQGHQSARGEKWSDGDKPRWIRDDRDGSPVEPTISMGVSPSTT